MSAIDSCRDWRVLPTSSTCEIRISPRVLGSWLHKGTGFKGLTDHKYDLLSCRLTDFAAVFHNDALGFGRGVKALAPGGAPRGLNAAALLPIAPGMAPGTAPGTAPGIDPGIESGGNAPTGPGACTGIGIKHNYRGTIQ